LRASHAKQAAGRALRARTTAEVERTLIELLAPTTP
jgi:hypothetical protein